ncbi:hypothetical protein CFC21_039460 [Triticum aestivum]|uniref:Uncharacterized protein n=1 Tax=Triticum aestivum TaxID=4565 RepID=A0A9R1FE76_WHEAT|nr:hypothetical protein CFC21_039460 [Triticum aestivum]
MCFEFGSCFGGGKDGRLRRRAAPIATTSTAVAFVAANAEGTTGAPTTVAPLTTKRRCRWRTTTSRAAAVDEAGHKAYDDGAGGRGGYAAYPQHKADLEAPKLPTWQNKVGEDAYTGRLHVQEPAAMDYPALGRY